MNLSHFFGRGDFDIRNLCRNPTLKVSDARYNLLSISTVDFEITQHSGLREIKKGENPTTGADTRLSANCRN